MAIILDGKALAKKIRENLKGEVEILKKEGIVPKLAVILVGEDPASKVYVRNKSNACKDVGIDYEEFLLPETITQAELLELIERLNNDEATTGILLQSPIPKSLNIDEAFKTISAKKDVDGFSPVNVGKLCLGQTTLVSCTPYGVMEILKEYGIETKGKNAVVIGRSNIVGKPMMQLLLNNDATVTVCHSKTQNLEEITKNADILVAAIGKPNFVTANMVKEGATVIDVGINRNQDGTLSGDVKFDEVFEKAEYITPVPGGVGPMTIAMLMKNVVQAATENN